MPKPRNEELTELAIAEIVLDRNIRELDTGPAFDELVASVKTHGVLEPLLVRCVDSYGETGKSAFLLVAGHRRIAAARAVGLKLVPVRVLGLNDTEASEVQLLENLLRKDLTPLEEARAIHAYSEAANAKPKEVAKRISKSETYVRERLRLLNLIPAGQGLLARGEMDVAHAVLVATLPSDAQTEFLDTLDDPLVGPVDEYFRTGIRQDATRYKERAELRELAAKSKFPSCPKCNQSPERQAYGSTRTKAGEIHVVMDSEEHVWDLNTGAVTSRRSVLDANPTIAKEREERRAERYDRSVSPALRLAEAPWQIAKRLVDETKDGITEIRIGRDPVTEALTVELLFEDDRPEAFSGKLPWGLKGGLYAVESGSLGVRTQAIADAPSAKDRKEILKRLAGLGKVLPAPEPTGKPSEILEGTVAEVAERIRGERRRKKGEADWTENRLFLEQLRTEEVAGKNRGSVLDALDIALRASTPTTASSDY